MPEKINLYEVHFIEFDKVKELIPDIETYGREDYPGTRHFYYNDQCYKLPFRHWILRLNRTQYKKIKKYNILNWSDTKFRRYLKIQKPNSEYQMIPDFGYPRELCIAVFRTKIQTNISWMKRALTILATKFTDKELQKYRSINHNNCGANRVDSPRIIYCWRNINNLSAMDIKYLHEILPKYSAQIIKYADKNKLQKFFDDYFRSNKKEDNF